ncbi:MAG: hypothetical protein KAX24_06750 [Anaerolineae bacterium]|nr:hypothetical protein [Anaerolineae bacterium]
MAKIAQATLSHYHRAEISWVLGNNAMRHHTAETLEAQVYRTYRIYEKEL